METPDQYANHEAAMFFTVRHALGRTRDYLLENPPTSLEEYRAHIENVFSREMDKLPVPEIQLAAIHHSKKRMGGREAC